MMGYQPVANIVEPLQNIGGVGFGDNSNRLEGGHD